MKSGGYFVGAVFVGKCMEISKTLHEYQPSKKTSKQNAHLQNQLKKVLEDWTNWFESASSIWAFWPGRNRNDLMYKGSPLEAYRGKIRSFPAGNMQAKPNLEQLLKAWNQLTSVEIVDRERRLDDEQYEGDGVTKKIRFSTITPAKFLKLYRRKSSENDLEEYPLSVELNYLIRDTKETLMKSQNAEMRKGLIQELTTVKKNNMIQPMCCRK